MIPVTDPFMSPSPPERRPGDFLRDRHGTPRVSDPDGATVKSGARKGEVKWQTYSRPSNYHKIIEDVYSITKWSERQEAYGFALIPELADRARVLIDIEDRESQAWKDEADKIVKAAKLAAKADLAADRGTHTHQLAEDDDEDRDIITRLEAGEELGLGPEVQQSLVACWREMLERDGLEILAVEMPVVNDTYRAAGTLDRVARLTRALRFRLLTGEIVELPAGTVVILDIKTGRRRLRDNGTVMYWHSYAVQVFLYGPTSRPYDTETDTRGEWQWEIDGKWALIAHLDVLGAIAGKPSCDLILVDLEAGRRAADLCVAAKAWSNDDTVFSVAQIAEGPSDAATTGTSSPSTPPSAGMPEPSAPLTVGEEAGAAVGHSPAMSKIVEEGMAFLVSSGAVNPDRLALVDARATLCANPDQGADLTDDGFDELWDRLRTLFDTLTPEARTWRSELAQQAKQRGVSFMAQEGKTERRYHINWGLIALAMVDADDDILRELLALVVGDVALFPSIQTGHLVGSLGAKEAERFAALADAYVADRLIAYVDDGCLRYREDTPISPPPAA